MKDKQHFRPPFSPLIPILFLILILSLCLPSWSGAESKTSPKAPAKAAAAAPAQSAQPTVNGVTQAAMKGGVQACAGRINQVANFLTAGTQGSGAFLFMPPATPDQRIFSVSMEIPTSPTSVAYASASFAPNQANGCGGMYETVVYWPRNCNAVAQGNFSNLKVTGVVAKNIAVLDAGGLTRIFLMPAGTGCVSIKKEIVQ